MSTAWEVDLGAGPQVLNVQKEMQKMQKESWLAFGMGILAAYPLFELFHCLGHRACYCYHHRSVHMGVEVQRGAKIMLDHTLVFDQLRRLGWHSVFRIALERITLLTLTREAV